MCLICELMSAAGSDYGSDNDSDGTEQRPVGGNAPVQFVGRDQGGNGDDPAVTELLKFRMKDITTSPRALARAMHLWGDSEVLMQLAGGRYAVELEEKLKHMLLLIAANQDTMSVSARHMAKLRSICSVVELTCPTLGEQPKSSATLQSQGKVDKEDRFVLKLCDSGFVRKSVVSQDAVRAATQAVPMELRLSRDSVSAFCDGRWSSHLTDSSEKDIWSIERCLVDDSLDTVSHLLLVMVKVKTFLRQIVPEEVHERFDATWTYLAHVRDVLLSQGVSVDAVYELMDSVFADLRNLATLTQLPEEAPLRPVFNTSSREDAQLRDMLIAFASAQMGAEVLDGGGLWGAAFQRLVPVDSYASKIFRDRAAATSRTMTAANPVAVANQLVAGFGAPKMWTRQLQGHCAVHLLAPGLCPRGHYCAYTHAEGQSWLHQQSVVERLLGSATVGTIQSRLMAVAEKLRMAASSKWTTGAAAASDGGGASPYAAFGSSSKARAKPQKPKQATAESSE